MLSRREFLKGAMAAALSSTIVASGVTQANAEGVFLPLLSGGAEEEAEQYVESAAGNLFSYWYNGFPTKHGFSIPWQNYEVGFTPSLTAKEYFEGWLFDQQSSLIFTQADSGPQHDVVPFWYDWKYDYVDGWSNKNWKTCMYLPMLFSPIKTFQPWYGEFKALLTTYPNKITMLGNEPHLPEQGATTAQQFIDAIADLYTVSPYFRWIGPNMLAPMTSSTAANWLSGFHLKLQAKLANDPNFPDPMYWGWHIYADSVQMWNDLYDNILSWMDLRGYTGDVVITETCNTKANATLNEQIAFMENVMLRADEPGSRLKIHFWFTGAHDTGTPPYSNHQLLYKTQYDSYSSTPLGPWWKHWMLIDQYTGQERTWQAPLHAPNYKIFLEPLNLP